MTEKKRFVLKSDYDWWGVLDTTGEIKGVYDDCFSTEEVVDLLNNMYNENQLLLKIGKQCLRKIETKDELITHLEKKNKELKQFKKRVFELIDNKIECYKDEISSYGSMYGAYLEDKLNELKKELEE